LKTAFISHPSCLLHPAVAGHPERPERVIAIAELLMSQGVYDFLLVEQAAKALVAELRRVHTAQHIERILKRAPVEGMEMIDEDTWLFAETPEAALHAAGAVILATEQVMTGAAQRAFCNVRPPGHHAMRDRAMGFCYFNNVAVGVAHALAVYGVSRIAILDFDAHDCNGTIDIFKDDPRVLICSTFQHPLYPYTGLDSPSDHVIKVGLAPGSGSTAFRQAVLERWLPAVAAFQPALIFVSAGFDAHVEDTASDLAFGDADYRWISEQIVELANRYSGGRVVSTLEGGYHLPALARAGAAHVRSLMDL